MARLDLRQSRVLRECRRRIDDFAAADVPSWLPAWRIREMEPEIDFGPIYSASTWFSVDEASERMAYLRAVRQLERSGFVVTHPAEGRRGFRVRLTEPGIAALAGDHCAA